MIATECIENRYRTAFRGTLFEIGTGKDCETSFICEIDAQATVT